MHLSIPLSHWKNFRFALIEAPFGTSHSAALLFPESWLSLPVLHKSLLCVLAVGRSNCPTLLGPPGKLRFSMSLLIFFLQCPSLEQGWLMFTTRNEMVAVSMIKKWEAVVIGPSPAVRWERAAWGVHSGLPSIQGLSSLLFKSQFWPGWIE